MEFIGQLNQKFKVILYSYLILKKMNERITDSKYINQFIHNERIKTKYIPSYIFKNGRFFKKRKLPKLNEFLGNLRCSNINGAMHTLLVDECLTGAKKRPLTKMLWSVSIKTSTFASVNTCIGSF